MIKREVTYNDFNGDEQKETFYFNLTVPEMLELNFGNSGDLESALKRLSNSRKIGELFRIIQSIIFKSVGVKSDDGKRFVKNASVLDEFKQSNAYEAFMLKMMQDEKYASNFIEELVPRDKVQGVSKVRDDKHELSMHRAD